MRLFIIASKPTDSVIFGFLPAAARLGLDVALLTDQPDQHERARADSWLRRRPGCVGGHVGAAPARILACDVRDTAELIAAIAALPAPDAIFSNSDRLQTQTALAASYFGLPGKDWRSAMHPRNKSLMRRYLAEKEIEQVAATETGPDFTKDLLRGGLHTLETVSDGTTRWVLGGFATQLSPPPFFIEERLDWDAAVPGSEHMLRALGGTFGACHTEYVLDSGRGPELIEVNDRMIGDHCDFVLADLLGTDLFELVLRLHLGERLPPGPPPRPVPGRAHAVVNYVVADRPGTLTMAPAAGPQPGAEPGVMLSYQPLRDIGEDIPPTRANRDYLGVLSAIGSDSAAVDRSVAEVRATACWHISSATG